jgi:putative resolvase
MGQLVWKVGTGLYGKRPKVPHLLSDPDAMVIDVEHWDRLARRAAEDFEAALSGRDRRMVVVDVAEKTNDLVLDMIEVPTNVCDRLHGRSGACKRTTRAVTAARVNGVGSHDR